MIDKKTFSKDFIEEQIKKYPHVDPVKMEMTIYAFGLLDELIRQGLPLIFKGGTSLLLLLDNPQRLSTDIDIIVPLDTDFDRLFEEVKTRFPFYEGEERGKKINNTFRHFYFMFNGPISGKPCRINLDVAFEENPYPHTLAKELTLPFLFTGGDKTFVNLPSHESIIGDKLTAFAPTTIGVNPFATSLGKSLDNRLQVMKQFSDIACLYDYVESLSDVLESYKKCHQFENSFRGTSYTIKETMLDTFNHAAEIASMGLWNKKSSFYNDVARVGMQGLMSNFINGKYNQVHATNDACKVMYLVACLLTNTPIDAILKEEELYKGKLMQPFKIINSKESFDTIRKAITLLVRANII